MDQDTTVNNALRDLKFRNIIEEKSSEQTERILAEVWAAGLEYQRGIDKKNRQGTCKRVDYFGRNDENLGTFKSITEAENELEIPRKTIYNTLSGKFKRMRNGHYFRYTDNGDDQHQ
ncbi:MAG: hypothetical protein JJE45_00415 [Prolixibacteraceae bacterium]|nr:hypothetical protein [Prolixibacteraceae bacterium]